MVLQCIPWLIKTTHPVLHGSSQCTELCYQVVQLNPIMAITSSLKYSQETCHNFPIKVLRKCANIKTVMIGSTNRWTDMAIPMSSFNSIDGEQSLVTYVNYYSFYISNEAALISRCSCKSLQLSSCCVLCLQVGSSLSMPSHMSATLLRFSVY